MKVAKSFALAFMRVSLGAGIGIAVCYVPGEQWQNISLFIGGYAYGILMRYVDKLGRE
jgi:hypothetical protein